MKLVLALEQRFNQLLDGSIWTQVAFAYPFWQRYLDVFDSVKVIARVQAVTTPLSDWVRADGKDVEFIILPYYVGSTQYLLHSSHVARIVRQTFNNNDAIICRVPSQIVNSGISSLQKQGKPYGVEVVGDPYNVFAPGVIKHPLRAFFRYWFVRHLRHQCAHASAAAYVTERTLQQRYTPQVGAFTTFYSSVDLPERGFIEIPHTFTPKSNSFNLITVGSLEQLYKGIDVLLAAMRVCTVDGLNLRLVILGDGKHRSELETLSISLGIRDHVHFLGQIPAGEAVREQLDQADLFVLPSRTEGLPRAMIEAMARGLPCIGSTVGGIPELLPPEDMVAPGDSAALAHKIAEVIRNPGRMTEMSARNLAKAHQYHESNLRERRIEFYQYLKDKTQEWLNR